MNYFRSIVTSIWWLAVAYLPVALFQFERRYSKAIGCPQTGDCYAPGSEHPLSLDVMIFGSALLLWPACLWFLVVRPLIFLVRESRVSKKVTVRRTTQKSVQRPDVPRVIFTLGPTHGIT